MRGLPNGDTYHNSMDKVKAVLHDVGNRYYRLSKRGKMIVW